MVMWALAVDGCWLSEEALGRSVGRRPAVMRERGSTRRESGMSYYLSETPDFAAHNEEVARVWKAYREGKPYRVPVSIHGSIRNYIQNPELNDTGWTFADFFTNPQAQIDCQLAYQKWYRCNLVCDREMGPPAHGWQLNIDFQNSYDAGWFGCPLHLDGNAVPDTVEVLKEDKGKLYEMECPDLLRGNLLGRAMEFFEYLHEKAPSMEFEGLPVLPPMTIPGEGMDGPLDCAYKLRGAAEILTDMLTDPGYYHDLMTFITDCLIKRMKAIREWRWERVPSSPDKGQFRRPYAFADDDVALVSVKQYEEFVLPYHQRFIEEFGDGGPISIHLCGDATHLFKFLHDRLNVVGFDTGFPVDHGALRRELGPDVAINGGPTVMLLQAGPPRAIREEVRRICESGVMEGGKFVLIAANNMAPCTPLEHVAAFYEAAKEYGRY
jgi:hypothetical protein